jgi:hypothetical protein
MKKSELKQLIREVIKEVSSDFNNSPGPLSIKFYNPVSQKWYIWGEPHRFSTEEEAKKEILRLRKSIGPLQFEITTDSHVQ